MKSIKDIFVYAYSAWSGMISLLLMHSSSSRPKNSLCSWIENGGLVVSSNTYVDYFERLEASQTQAHFSQEIQ